MRRFPLEVVEGRCDEDVEVREVEDVEVEVEEGYSWLKRAFQMALHIDISVKQDQRAMILCPLTCSLGSLIQEDRRSLSRLS